MIVLHQTVFFFAPDVPSLHALLLISVQVRGGWCSLLHSTLKAAVHTGLLWCFTTRMCVNLQYCKSWCGNHSNSNDTVRAHSNCNIHTTQLSQVQAYHRFTLTIKKDPHRGGSKSQKCLEWELKVGLGILRDTCWETFKGSLGAALVKTCADVNHQTLMVQLGCCWISVPTHLFILKYPPFSPD